MKRSLAAAVLFAASTFASAATVVVTPTNLDGWQPTMSGGSTVTFEQGPGTPPLGTGSAELKVDASGATSAQLRNKDYAGTKLSDLTALSYSTYVVNNNGGQAPYILLNIDNDGNGTIDDQLFFEPVYQSGTYPSSSPVPNQCGANPACVSLNTWQTWNALVGGWWSLNALTFGPPLVTLADYIAAHPNATIVNSPSGLGGVRIVTGFGGPADWGNFDGNVDAFTIGVSGSGSTTFDFELFSTPSNANQCKNGGWKTFNPPSGPYKNQGQCVSSVNKNK